MPAFVNPGASVDITVTAHVDGFLDLGLTSMWTTIGQILMIMYL
ncbi:MAG: hypothetical protein R2750_02275 [Bacteroidales bacterium]